LIIYLSNGSVSRQSRSVINPTVSLGNDTTTIQEIALDRF
jgi:hypothetical protein